MPHSSGGGSHSGGSHGGSHRSSHRGSSSGGQRSSGYTSSSYFPGARRFVYYQHNRPNYVYADYDITEKTIGSRYLLLIFYIPFYVALIFMMVGAYHSPKKLALPANYGIYIEDNLHLIDQKEALQAALKQFQDETGITPAVITVEKEAWDKNYVALENYAYDRYVNLFPDEKHWLIVYSEPKDASGLFNDWSWEGMQGDDTDPVLTSKMADKFTTDLQRYLTARSRYSVSTALINSFSDLQSVIMKRSIDGTMLGTGLFIMGFVTIHMYFMVFFSREGENKELKSLYQTAKECTELVEEDTCDYCGGIYVIGTCISCPHCGAGLKPHTYKKNVNGSSQFQSEAQNMKSEYPDIFEGNGFG